MKAQPETVVSIEVLVFPPLVLFFPIKCFIDNLNLSTQSQFLPHILQLPPSPKGDIFIARLIY